MKVWIAIFAIVSLHSVLVGKEAPNHISTGKIAPGTEWETGFVTIDSGIKGPVVLIVGGMHGNEPAGARAAEQIANWPIRKGKLVIVSRANVPALKANTRNTPGQPEEAANLNRNFPTTENTDDFSIQPRGELAAALWRFAFKTKPDWIIDLHEGYEFNRSHKPPEGQKKSVGSSVIYDKDPETDDMVKRVVAAADETVTNPDRRFVLIGRGPVDTGLARACIRVMGAKGMILETTYKNQPLSLRTRQHRAMVNVLLNDIGLIDRDCTSLISSDSQKLQVGVFDGSGVGRGVTKLVSAIRSDREVDTWMIGPHDIRGGKLDQFDVIVFPGGSGSKQAAAIGEVGRKAVREFVADGGGVVGVCAGAYLCSSGYRWSLDIVDSKAFTGTVEIEGKGKKQLWYRGRETDIDIELSSEGRDFFAGRNIPGDFVVKYCNGPIISRHEEDILSDYTVLAWFRSENGLWEAQKNTMINTPAIVSGNFEKGRVVSISPHPENTKALHPIITHSIRWVANSNQ